MKKENITMIKNMLLGSFLWGSFTGLETCVWATELLQLQAISSGSRIKYDDPVTCELVRKLEAAGQSKQSPNFAELMDLINHGAHPYVGNSRNWTLWHFAAKFNRSDILLQFIEKVKIFDLGQECLIDCFNQKNAIGRTPIHEAVMNNSNEVLPILIWNGGDLLAKDNCGQTPLHIAAHVGNLFAMRTLIWGFRAKQSDLLQQYVNESDDFGETALYAAIASNKYQAAKILLAYGAFLGIQNSFGRTPLHKAVSKGDSSMIQMLLETADHRLQNQPNDFERYVNTTDCLRKTALDIARTTELNETKKQEIIRILRHYGPRMDVESYF
ncbi:MAG: ankyrin repeat domain-containing protein [Puniceicoccales bacterium]|jgi:ankyrin repeat protein|nr:ankyrin repeat domain-containing protein [Puniceicoccales bacterium]